MDAPTTQDPEVEELDDAEKPRKPRSLAPLRMVYREAAKYPKQVFFALLALGGFAITIALMELSVIICMYGSVGNL